MSLASMYVYYLCFHQVDSLLVCLPNSKKIKLLIFFVQLSSVSFVSTFSRGFLFFYYKSCADECSNNISKVMSIISIGKLTINYGHYFGVHCRVNAAFFLVILKYSIDHVITNCHKQKFLHKLTVFVTKIHFSLR